jgi:phosphatidylserine decarboxylase
MQPLSVQPGGGLCHGIELAWGHLRRWYLKRFRPAYVARMAALRQGDTTGAPHEILDPRDLKYCSTMCSAYWRLEDDPFAWRDRLPFARWGLAELQIMGWPLAAAFVAILFLCGPWKWLAIAPTVLLALLVYFFRDPLRLVPDDPNAIVSPADGTVVEVTALPRYDFLDGPATRVSIFLSLFNVHVNRAPLASRVVDMHYKPGEFLNAMRPESAERNESMWIGLETLDEPTRRFAVRQVSGLVARRIVCAVCPGRTLTRGQKFGMIKLGSRTELILPPEAEVLVEVGAKIKAGTDIVARWRAS